jgi:hypothetical protein
MRNGVIRRRLWTAAWWLGFAASASGQPPARGATPGVVPLAEEPFRIQSVGLSIRLPEGASTEAQRAGDRSLVRVNPSDLTWLMNIDTPQSRDGTLVPSKVADQVLKEILDSFGVPLRKLDPNKGLEIENIETTGIVLERTDALVIPGSKTPGARFYVKVPRGAGETAAIRGYTVFQIGPGRFVTFDLATTEPEFARAKRCYETSLATVTFDDANALAMSRGAAVEAGITLMSQLTPDALRSIIESRGETWYRIYKEAPTKSDADATELGYQRVRAWVGQRGELDPGKEKSRWQSADRQQGFLVLIEGRSLVDGSVVDSRGVYFMTPDRSEETWSLQMAFRKAGRKNPETWLETGARSASSMSVTVNGVGQAAKQARPVVPEQGYVTLVESMVLPQVMIRAGESREYGFYMYQSEFGNVRLRRDVSAEVADAPGTWRITTRMTEDKEPRVSLYRSSGELISTRHPDGTIMEPTTFQRLVDLWRRKGLPMN